ncbi:NXPE family member 4-like [Branchiostoma floridae]|uniref:NXPE family member 4-like n=1 Tax=Branchiostoma floridae TaxID=7739 RepID=A0A9J7MLK7_BRAFL|nr:NXPE family member 4-like [Branchiostoma floridae]
MVAVTQACAVFVTMTSLVLISIKFSYQPIMNWGQHATNFQEAPKPMLKLHSIKKPVQPINIKPLTIEPSLKPITVNPLVKQLPMEQPLHVTCSQNTKIVVLNRDRPHRQGDVLTAIVTARDQEGRPKTYGGDFFRARLIRDGSPQASSAGHIIDHDNGTYTVEFPLHWLGNVRIKIQLVHPSEAVKVLWRLRDIPNKIGFQCSFFDEKTKITEKRECFSSASPSLQPDQQCDLSKPEVNGTWFCQRPKKVPCTTIAKCRSSKDRVLGLVSQEEVKYFQKPHIEEELKNDVPLPIRVLEPELPTPPYLPACTWNMPDAQMKGFWLGKVWKSSVCNVRVFTPADIKRCLADKTVYMQGDSTLRQWYIRFKELLTLNITESGDYSVLEYGKNSYWNITIRYRFHYLPIQGKFWLPLSQLSYAADQLDTIQGGPNTVIVLGLWAHFTAEPLEVIQSRLYAIRLAIHRLLHRAPGTRVFVRTGTTREHKNGKLQHYLLRSDWLAYQITEMIREMFLGEPGVVVLDTWDMSVCQPGKDNVHPDQTMVDNELNVLLSYIC